MRLGAAAGFVTTLWRDARDLRAANARDASFVLDGVRHRAAVHSIGEPRSGVLLLHTARGLTMHDRAIARRLARSGFAVMTLQYSVRTRGEITRDDEACRRIDRICAEAFDRLRRDEAVSQANPAVLGLSLGGYFAMRLAAAQTRLAPRRVVVWYGVYPSALSLLPRLRSPLLIVQGTRDAAAFVQSAEAAASLAPDRVELLKCQGLRHQFDVFQPLSRGAQHAWQRTVEFLTDVALRIA